MPKPASAFQRFMAVGRYQQAMAGLEEQPNLDDPRSDVGGELTLGDMSPGYLGETRPSL